MPDLMSPAEVAEAFDVHPATVRRWAADGKIAAVMTPGGRRKYHRADVAQMLGIRADDLTAYIERKTIEPVAS